MNTPSYRDIREDRELLEYVEELRTYPRFGLDTEFVSEGRYLPELCLVQIATDDSLCLIDPMTVRDMTPLWDLVATPGREVVIHAARGEVEFCVRSSGRFPTRLFDTQIAAGLVDVEYPAGLRSLLSKFLNLSAAKAETRTDWRRRPLSDRQIHYALDDVRHLMALHDRLNEQLGRMDRGDWFREEMSNWQADVEQSLSTARWRKVSGNTGLSRRQQAIVRELWTWREGVAKHRNCPARRVLRDDLIIELAKRGSSDPKRITAVRGLQRGDLNRAIPQLCDAVQKALDLSDDECPRSMRESFPPQFNVLGQFMFAALTSICRQKSVASGLVGSSNDVRELIAHHTGDLKKKQHPPKLAVGWRADVVGASFEELLSGRVGIRIEDPASDHPLVMSPIANNGDGE